MNKFALVGYTGFVGSNIAASYHFDGLYNSKNIEDAYGTSPDLLVFAGLPAEKFLANKDPEGDMQKINVAIENIKKIAPKKLVLISTIDVYPNPLSVYEDTDIDTTRLLPYGKNRLYLERFVEQYFEDYLIVRLPGLFGRNIKKNFIYDYIHFIPALLNETKYKEIAPLSSLIGELYKRQDNGFYKCFADDMERKSLRKEFERVGFSALNFTDSRGYFQYYNLDYLWQDIYKAMLMDIRKLNLSTEPIGIAELYTYLCGREFKNEILQSKIPNYNFKSRYDTCFDGKNGYLYSKDVVLHDIKEFVEGAIQ